MKAVVLLLALAITACTSGRLPKVTAPVDGAEYYQTGRPLAEYQRRLYPDPQGGLGHSQDPDIRVTDIRLTASYTVVYMQYGKDPNERDNNHYGSSNISFNPKAVLSTTDGKKTFALVKAEGIPLTPQSMEIKGSDRVPFILYFERLDRGIERFDLFECKSDNENSCFNVAGIQIDNPLASAQH